jgi:hypothetical protein
VLVTLWIMALQEEAVEILRKAVHMAVLVINSTVPVTEFALLVAGVMASSSPA